MRKTTNVEDVFQSDVDAVIIAAPVRTSIIIWRKEALLHGKHVLVEKPLTPMWRRQKS